MFCFCSSSQPRGTLTTHPFLAQGSTRHLGATACTHSSQEASSRVGNSSTGYSVVIQVGKSRVWSGRVCSSFAMYQACVAPPCRFFHFIHHLLSIDNLSLIVNPDSLLRFPFHPCSFYILQNSPLSSVCIYIRTVAAVLGSTTSILSLGLLPCVSLAGVSCDILLCLMS